MLYRNKYIFILHPLIVNCCFVTYKRALPTQWMHDAHHNNNITHVFCVFRVEEVHEFLLAQAAILVSVSLLPPPAVAVDHVSIRLRSGAFHVRICCAEAQSIKVGPVLAEQRLTRVLDCRWLANIFLAYCILLFSSLNFCCCSCFLQLWSICCSHSESYLPATHLCFSSCPDPWSPLYAVACIVWTDPSLYKCSLQNQNVPPPTPPPIFFFFFFAQA